MSALDQIRRRHAQELFDAQLAANIESQIDPAVEKEAIEEGLRMAREVLEAELPIAEQPVAKLEAEIVALEAEAEQLEQLPQKRAAAFRHMAEARAAAMQAFDATEFLQPVEPQRMAELAALWVAGSRAFRDEPRGRLDQAFDQEERPEHVESDWQPRLTVIHHRLVELRAEIWRRSSAARSAELAAGKAPRNKGRLRAAVGAALSGSPAVDVEDDAGFKGPR